MRLLDDYQPQLVGPALSVHVKGSHIDLHLVAESVDDVTIALVSSDTTEGTVSTSTVTFTSDNWDQPQKVTVTGVDDDVDDGDIAYTIVTAPATSADSTYSGINPTDVTVTNLDDDTAGIAVAPTSFTISEPDGSGNFVISLGSEPTEDVEILLNTSNNLTLQKK